MNVNILFFFFFFFNDTATTEIYTLSLHDALPISKVKWTRDSICELCHNCRAKWIRQGKNLPDPTGAGRAPRRLAADRKSTRLNSSHSQISYAVFCLKKKKKYQLQNSALVYEVYIY